MYHAYVVSNTTSPEDGVYSYQLDERNGRLKMLSSAPAGEAPSFLTIHNTSETLYIVNTVDNGSILAFSSNSQTGEFSELNRKTTGGAGPCYCSIDTSGNYIFVANYRSGNVSMLSIQDDGRLGKLTDIVNHEGSSVDGNRQNQPHPHAIVPGPDNRFAYVPDLGTDRVFIYEINLQEGKLQPADPPSVTTHEGAGPRHLTFHPNERFVYLINELDSTLTAFERNKKTGALEEIATVNTLPNEFDGENLTADIHVHPSGRYLYSSNRGHDSIAIFELNEATGHPYPIGYEPTGGEWPRNFAIGPTGTHLFVENMHDGNVITFDIDEETGRLTATNEATGLPRPMCMKIVKRS